ncbi:MAG TPA: BNR repeat-containing protein [Armatimonadota bacterium]|nr:BNR repeat-containing protein [Armatimonadota bacterium]
MSNAVVCIMEIMMRMTRLAVTGAVIMLLIMTMQVGAAPGTPEVVDSVDVSDVPASFPLGFSLLTHGKRQFVAFYDKDHHMVVAQRDIPGRSWQFRTLPEKVGYDSHNYVTLAADADGFLHLSGNMHVSPLVYFRSREPWDITTLERVPSMVGREEDRCTYPQFMRGPHSELIFHYRSGSSGKGNEIFNVYDPGTRRWRRLLDAPLTDGQGKMNAYMSGPTAGPDGFYHLVWVWRDTPHCSTNHDVSYARSRDLVHWEAADGQPLRLPITPETGGSVIVDPVPVKGGLINGATRVGFDSANHAVVTYQRYDAAGKTQAYAARFQDGHWFSKAVSRWDYRWEFSGKGSIIFQVGLGSARPVGPGRLGLWYSHVKYGVGILIFDEKTFAPLGMEPAKPDRPPALNRPQGSFPGLQVRWQNDTGKSDQPGVRYALRWETLPANRDHQPTGPVPPSSRLKVYTFKG